VNRDPWQYGNTDDESDSRTVGMLLSWMLFPEAG
jgi:hypothetical protein